MTEKSLAAGFSFGLTSGVITTLGLIIGLSSSTHSKLVIIGGVLTIAVADAFSDALGMHISQESENEHSAKEVWLSTLVTFLAKFIFALTFIAPVLLLPLSQAVGVSILWGLSLLGVFSYHIGKREKAGPWRVMLEHLVIALLVIVITNQVGKWVGYLFN